MKKINFLNQKILNLSFFDNFYYLYFVFLKLKWRSIYRRRSRIYNNFFLNQNKIFQKFNFLNFNFFKLILFLVGFKSLKIYLNFNFLKLINSNFLKLLPLFVCEKQFLFKFDYFNNFLQKNNFYYLYNNSYMNNWFGLIYSNYSESITFFYKNYLNLVEKDDLNYNELFIVYSKYENTNLFELININLLFFYKYKFIIFYKLFIFLLFSNVNSFLKI